MDTSQNNNQFQSASVIDAGGQENSGRNSEQASPVGQESDNQPKVHSRAVVFIALGVVIFVLIVVFSVLLKQGPAPTSLGVDKNGVPIINLNKGQVVDRVESGQPLNEPEVHAVFRWAVEHPDEAARLSPEEKANIIRALNE